MNNSQILQHWSGLEPVIEMCPKLQVVVGAEGRPEQAGSSSASWPKGEVVAVSTVMKEFPIHCALTQGE